MVSRYLLVACWIFLHIFKDLVLCGNVTKDARNIKENAKGATVKWNIIPSKNEILVNTHVYLRREQGDTLVVTSYPIALVTSKGNEIFESGLSAKCYVNHINATSLRDKVYELEIQRLNENRNLTFVLTGFFRNLNDGIVRTDEDMTIIILKGVLEKSKKLSIVKIFVATFLPLVIIFACSVCCWKARQTAQTVGVGDNVLEKNTPEVMPKDSTSEKTASFHIQLEEKKGSISCEGEP